MCGIVGYVGPRKAQDLIYSGLARLEYRGYDSAGIAVIDARGGKPETRIIKAPGKLKELRKFWDAIDFPSGQAIGHTRWATHGEANEVNAHPHKVGYVTIVHNGIIENHQEIRKALASEGVKFLSQTDTELFSHMISRRRARGESLVESVRKSFQEIQGASAFVVMDEREPGRLVVVRNGSPLVLGIGKDENFVASDVPAILDSTREVCYLDDNEMAEITAERVRVLGLDGKEIPLRTRTIDWQLDAIDKQGYAHYMLKEIFEQPRALLDTLSAFLDKPNGRFTLDALAVSKKVNEERRKFTEAELVDVFAKSTQVHIVACGTARHAGLYGQILMEKIARIPAQCELASEFRYRDPVLRPTDVGLVVSQSGETADTLAAVKLMKERGMKVFAICNVRDSSIPRECDGVLYTNAGIEIGVASTKAFTTQMALFAVLAGALARRTGAISERGEREWVEALLHLPHVMQKTLDHAPELEALAKKYKDKKGFLYLGRGLQHPIALEGALKLKEIAYVHAEGYPSGELKHGPIAMVEPDILVLAIAPEGKGMVHQKSVSNIEEVKARRGTLLGLGAKSDSHFREICHDFVEVTHTDVEELLAIVSVVPLQLFSYYVAVARGTEVDQPRNLAKSVTVE